MVIYHEKVVVNEVLSENGEIPHEIEQFRQGILRIRCVLIPRRILMMILYNPFLEPPAWKQPYIGR